MAYKQGSRNNRKAEGKLIFKMFNTFLIRDENHIIHIPLLFHFSFKAFRLYTPLFRKSFIKLFFTADDELFKDKTKDMNFYSFLNQNSVAYGGSYIYHR